MPKKTYTTLPVVPPELSTRYETVTAVISGSLSVSEGARRLGLSRNHFQSLIHQVLEAMIEALSPKPGGRPRVPERERLLEMEAGSLRLQNERLLRRVETAERILGVARGFLRGRMDRRRSRDREAKPPSSEDE